jgi:hypothetical protein
MRLVGLLLLGLSIVLVSLSLAESLSLGWIDQLAEALWELPRAVSELEEEWGRQPVLEARCQAALQRGNRKIQVVEEVIAGRLSLVEAAARFRDLWREEPPVSVEGFRRYYAGASDEERYCRAVIGCSGTMTTGQPEKDQEVTRRLEAELAELLRSGTLRLPR